MCGRCEGRCPVGLELNTLRLNSRCTLSATPGDQRYSYAKGIDTSQGEGRVGYFAGCMTLLSPRILRAMESIFNEAGESVWWADREGGVCCGRPLKLSGDVEAAREMMTCNTDLFRKHAITTLVTSCPICLKVFREDYDLEGIEVLHHSEYIERLMTSGRITIAKGTEKLTYHDPCELGRGSGIYDEPRRVLGAIGTLAEPRETRENALCCGSSVANTAIDNPRQTLIARGVGEQLEATGADTVVTACPLCKKAIARGTSRPVLDLAEIVEKSLVRQN
jgi:Fe-S oxidoreductase